MKHFLIYIAAGLLPVITFLGVGEWLVRQVPNAYRYKEEWMEAHHNEVNTLILGTSHSYAAVKPDMMDKDTFGVTFNLANPWQTLDIDYFLWQKFDCPQLKMLLIPISYPTFFFENMGVDSKKLIFYKLYMDYPAKPFYSNFEFFDLQTFGAKVRTFFFPLEDIGYDEYGWTTNYKLKHKNPLQMLNGDEARTHTRKKWKEAMEISEKNYAILQHIADDCKQREIKLVLFTTPAWYSYRNLIDSRQFARMHELITRFLQQNEGTMYFDYLDDSRFTDEDFCNSNHLSDIGAEKFTKILCNDIEEQTDALAQ